MEDSALLSMSQWMSISVGIFLIVGFLYAGVRGIYRLVNGLDKMTTVMEVQQKELAIHKEDDLMFQKAMLKLFDSLDISKTLLIKVCARLKIDTDEVIRDEAIKGEGD